MIVKVTTQTEMEEALKNPASEVWLIGSGVFTVTDSASVTAWDSASVTAWGSASVRAWDSASVTAWGSASVRAWGSASVRASDSASVTASSQVPVQILSPTVKAKGGVQIKHKAPAITKEWLENYGVITARGIAILYKGVDAEYRSPRGGIYTPGTKPVCSDWDGGKAECGGGFHFSPAPFMTLKFAPEATKFVACPIKVSEIVVHKNAHYPDKVKAPRVYGACYEVDINGNRV